MRHKNEHVAQMSIKRKSIKCARFNQLSVAAEFLLLVLKADSFVKRRALSVLNNETIQI
jgi:hypothetical protein